MQRVTKYPLLLARLYKVTPAQQESRESLKEARRNIELHLEHMNSVSGKLVRLSIEKCSRLGNSKKKKIRFQFKIAFKLKFL